MAHFLTWTVLAVWSCFIYHTTAVSFDATDRLCKDLNNALNSVIFLQDEPEYPDLRTENW